MVRRSAERQGQSHAGQSRQEQDELRGILGGEQTREPSVRGVVDGETSLHASDVAAFNTKSFERCAELAPLGPVLGIVDYRERASCKRQSCIERFRFGARAAPGSDDELELR